MEELAGHSLLGFTQTETLNHWPLRHTEGDRLAIRPDSPLIGQTLDELQLRARYGANVIGVERIHNFHRVFVGVSTLSEFKAGDVLLIDMAAPTEAVRYLCQMEGLLPLVLRADAGFAAAVLL